MRILQTSFVFLQVSGFWRPVSWSGWKMWLYNIYTIFAILTLYSVTLSQLVELLRSIDNVQEFIKSSLILLTTTNACAKVANILQKRDDIIKLISTLRADPCYARDNNEKIIQEKFNVLIRQKSLLYITLTEVSVFFVTLGTILTDTPQRQLAFKAWLPYTCNTEVSYWLTYVQQIVANTMGSFINLSYDTLIPGFMMQIVAQLELLKNRLEALSDVRKNLEDLTLTVFDAEQRFQVKESKIVAKLAQHHLTIFKLRHVK